MTIEFKDIVLLNDELRKQHTRYRIVYKNENTACIEPPGECCLTDNMKKKTKECIREYYGRKNARVFFSEDFLYFHVEPA